MGYIMNFTHIFMHSLSDVLGILPFLFISYVILEYIEHKSQDKVSNILVKSKRIAPLFGGLAGLFPSCGFSAMASSFYATRVISLGTLFAVYLSTSDEIIPIFLSEGVDLSFLFYILFIKFLVAVVCGFIIDAIFFKNRQYSIRIKDFCECEKCSCHNGIILSALRHSIKIFLWVFVITFVLGILIEMIGEDAILVFLSDKGVIVKFITAFIGLIPNCASSVILSKLYISGVIDFSSLITGLLVGSGVGLIVLFKMNKSFKENLYIAVGLYFIAVLTGFLIQSIWY